MTFSINPYFQIRALNYLLFNIFSFTLSTELHENVWLSGQSAWTVPKGQIRYFIFLYIFLKKSSFSYYVEYLIYSTVNQNCTIFCFLFMLKTCSVLWSWKFYFLSWNIYYYIYIIIEMMVSYILLNKKRAYSHNMSPYLVYLRGNIFF